MATLRQEIDELLAKYEPRVRAAFEAAIDDLTGGADLTAFADAMDQGDIEAALDALNLDEAAMNRVQDAIAAAYSAGGEMEAGRFPLMRSNAGVRVKARFDVRAPGAEAWLLEQSSSRITGPRGSIDAIRETIRPVLAQRLAEGQNPRQTGLDIVGRINRATGRREGGLIGLAAPHIETVERVRVGLLSDDPDAAREAMRHYLTLARKDGRMANSIRRLLEEGKTPTAQSVERITRNLKASYLQLRGETIGRTETLQALNASRDESFRQALAKTNYGPDQVIKTWQSAGDGRVRHTHAAMSGNKVSGMDGVFQSPNGASLRYPGDTDLGAGAEEIVGCRCVCSYRIDVFGRGV